MDAQHVRAGLLWFERTDDGGLGRVLVQSQAVAPEGQMRLTLPRDDQLVALRAIVLDLEGVIARGDDPRSGDLEIAFGDVCDGRRQVGERHEARVAPPA